MILEFRYTFEDLQEAAAAHQQQVKKIINKNPATTTTGASGTVFVLVLALILFMLTKIDVPQRPILPDLLVPGTAMFLLVPALAFRSNKAVVRGTLSRRIGNLVVFIFALIGFTGIWFFISWAFIRPGKMTWQELFSPHLLWLLITLVMVFFVSRITRNQLHLIWSGTPALQQPHRLELTDTHLLLSSSYTRVEHQWYAFPLVLETQNLFLLYISDHTWHMVPKRALPDAASVESFRALLDEKITNRPSAFAVLPIEDAQPPPLPPTASPPI